MAGDSGREVGSIGARNFFLVRPGSHHFGLLAGPQIFEIVGHAAGQHTQTLQLLGVLNLFLEPPSLFFRPPTVRQVGDDSFEALEAAVFTPNQDTSLMQPAGLAPGINNAILERVGGLARRHLAPPVIEDFQVVFVYEVTNRGSRFVDLLRYVLLQSLFRLSDGRPAVDDGCRLI